MLYAVARVHLLQLRQDLGCGLVGGGTVMRPGRQLLHPAGDAGLVPVEDCGGLVAAGFIQLDAFARRTARHATTPTPTPSDKTAGTAGLEIGLQAPERRELRKLIFVTVNHRDSFRPLPRSMHRNDQADDGVLADPPGDGAIETA